MDASVLAKIADAPRKPGVYLMKDGGGRVFYVGKAVDLHERLRAYIAGSDQRRFVPLLEDLLAEIEIVVVQNEKEALLLENELIRRHRPRFNMRPGAGRNFVYLRLDVNEPYSRLEVTRQVRDDGARYFGPYPLARALRETLRVINRYFRLRTCADHDDSMHPRRACLLCQISRFPATSVYDIPAEEYRNNVENAMRFLEGKRDELVADLRQRMSAASATQRFEEAARLRDQLNAIARTLQPQKIVSSEIRDQDAFGTGQEGDRRAIYVLHVRRGHVIGGHAFPFSETRYPPEKFLASFLAFYYEESSVIPDEILLPFDVEMREELEDSLSQRKGGSTVRLLVPNRGTRRRLVDMSASNAAEVLRKQLTERPDAERTLEGLRARLGLSRLPHRIECFDVSHLQGSEIVASRVSMIDGDPDKRQYRRYRIKSVQVGNDFAATYEVVSRRLRRAAKFSELPDLFVIDGGKGQLTSALAAVKDAGVSGLDVIALAKERKPTMRDALNAKVTRLPERVFVPNRRDPVILPSNSPEMHMLARIRDEAHRFAIGYQRQLMRKARVRSQLETIPGIGASRRRSLLRHFGSLERIRNASVDELAQVAGMGELLARHLYARLHAKETARDPAFYLKDH